MSPYTFVMMFFVPAIFVITAIAAIGFLLFGINWTLDKSLSYLD